MSPKSAPQPDAARRRFFFIQVALAPAFAAIIIATSFAVPRMGNDVARWMLSAGPLALLALWAWEFVRVIRAQDEMLQPLQLRAIAISAGLVLVGGTMWGVLERLLALPAFPLFLLLPAFAVVYGVVWVAVGLRR